MRKVLGIFLGLIVVSIPLSGVYASSGISTMSASLIEKAAPDFTLDTLSKSAVKMSEYREGKSAIIFFWATWCPHCRVQLKELNSRAKELEDNGIKLVIVDLGEDRESVQSYVKKNNIGMDMFLDIDSSLSDPYRLVGVPTFYLIDAKGMVKAIQHSFPEDYQDLLQRK